MNKRIGMILGGNYPPDIRVDKEAKSLIKSGFDVFLLCPRTMTKRNLKVINNLNVVYSAIPTPTLFSRVDNLFGMLFFVYPSWLYNILRFLFRYKIDYIHVHDLPLGYTAYLCSKIVNKPIIVDLHENYPAGLQVWTAYDRTFKGRIKGFFTSYRRWIKYEKKVCTVADRLICVVDEMRERVINEHSISLDKIFIVSNTESLSFCDNMYHEKLSEFRSECFTISYIGGLGPHRGIDCVIRAIHLLNNAIPNLKFIIIGKSLDGKYESHLQTIIDEHNLNSTVKMLGWMPFNDTLKYFINSDVGLIPHSYNEHTDNTIPHKIFQYMMLGVPVIVSNCRPLMNLVNDTNCGFVFEADNPASFSEVLRKVFSNSSKLKSIGDNGYHATVHGNLNWEICSRRLINLYEGL